jgi:hypothetical protein
MFKYSTLKKMFFSLLSYSFLIHKMDMMKVRTSWAFVEISLLIDVKNLEEGLQLSKHGEQL